jgi:thioredoxin-like negative regulator of GroEL
MTVQIVTSKDYGAFIVSKWVVAVHFDAEWDEPRAKTRERMLEAEMMFGEQVGFGEVDVDVDAELAKGIPVMNVPLVAYYRDGRLVAALIGADQDILARVERVIRGEVIGYKDGTSR